MPNPLPRAVLLCFDGVVHVSDLPVQAFARHVTEQLSAERVRAVIAGMRGFLEGKPELIPPDIDLTDAEDGDDVVEILARAAGVDDASIRGARRASREDLAASAWAVDPTEGLEPLLAEIDGAARVLLLTGPGDPATRPVLESIDLRVDEILDTSVALAVTRVMQQMGTTAEPKQIMIIGTRWTGQLRPAWDAGCTTALVDRYRRGRGTPAFRSADLGGLLDAVRGWLSNSPAWDTVTGPREQQSSTTRTQQ